MLKIDIAEEPDDFDEKVRTPGHLFVNGQTSRRDLDFTNRTYWTKAIPDLRRAYNSVCAYCCHWIAVDTGMSTVDHFVPKSRDGYLAYEWDNLRLVSHRYNSRKGTREIVDPFNVNEGSFIIEFPTLLIRVSEDRNDEKILFDTIDILKLNDDICMEARERHVGYYIDDGNEKRLREEAPFILQEIKRQNLSRDDLRDMGLDPETLT